MKKLNNYVTERLHITKKTKISIDKFEDVVYQYNFTIPKTGEMYFNTPKGFTQKIIKDIHKLYSSFPQKVNDLEKQIQEIFNKEVNDDHLEISSTFGYERIFVIIRTKHPINVIASLDMRSDKDQIKLFLKNDLTDVEVNKYDKIMSLIADLIFSSVK